MQRDASLADDLFGFDYPDPPAVAPPSPTEAVSAPPSETAPEPAAATPAVLPEARVSTLTQIRAALRVARYHARRTWRDARSHPGGPVYTIEHFQPPSIGDADHLCTACGATTRIPGQIQYRDGRGWVQANWYGGWSEKWGAGYHTWFSIPAMIPAVCWIWLVIRPFRMSVFLAVLAATIALAWALYGFGVI